MDEIDNEYFENDAVYYDASVGEFYTFRRVPGGVQFLTPEREKVETMDSEEFRDLQDDLYRVPEEAVENPVRYFENQIAQWMDAQGTMCIGLMFADRATEVVERDSD